MNTVVLKKVNAKKVIFNPPATIVYWDDGTKTVVKCSEKDIFDEEKGVVMCYMKKQFGERYYKGIKTLLKNAERHDKADKKPEHTINDIKEIPKEESKNEAKPKEPQKKYVTQEDIDKAFDALHDAVNTKATKLSNLIDEMFNGYKE